MKLQIPLYRKGCRLLFFITKELTRDRTSLLSPLVSCERMCLTASLVPYFPRLPSHMLPYISVLCFTSTLRNLTAIFFRLPPA